ncbi:hypothetical protein BGZ61DRAFT_363754 [Ilyonectria robusta]|uniref:uncharacterized protein n=1 Tax=Ilyonectria robusta TaxID=1079257 RepID=UPI001E8DC357|nr:uncharacterized protein BGZ61DRAFT_363754 [Ilyonectria robusta]KAH8669801.1 hypothetical protein BGZ61DRAFT_363754 [Ilyonectria robusta]
MKAYYYDDLPGDQRLPHDSGREVDVDALLALGVYYYHLPELQSVNELAEKRGYRNRDEIKVSPKTMGDVYEEKVKMFFLEHLHEDEEIRYIRDGRGYFDVRSKNDEWVRVQLDKDDLLILPAGIYHRFTTDEDNFVHAMRLFKDEPKWTALNRDPKLDENTHRQQYVKEFLAQYRFRRTAELGSCRASSPPSTPTLVPHPNFATAFTPTQRQYSQLRAHLPYLGRGSRGKMDTRTEASDATDASGKPRPQLPTSCDPPHGSTSSRQLVWIVFGGTGHMGRSLVKCALSRGDLVTSVGRVFETTPSEMAGIHENCLGALCDVRARDSVCRVVERTLTHFGRIDVVANCSGYGVIGACEDQDEHDLRNQFETNFMGTLHIIHATLPYFRRQNGGRYLILSSTSGALGVPGLGPYCATKYAVEGLIEAMLYETDAFNIKATLIEPGHVRRDEPETPNNPLPTWGHFLIKPASEAYGHATSPALHAKRMVQWLGDRQPTSAVKCAELIWQLAHCSYPPLRLLLGSYAIESIRDRMRSVTEELEDWKHLNFPAAPEDEKEGGEDMVDGAPESMS